MSGPMSAAVGAAIISFSCFGLGLLTSMLATLLGIRRDLGRPADAAERANGPELSLVSSNAEDDSIPFEGPR